MKSAWPNGHRFAFTVFDDTDWATVGNVKPVYDLLAGLGIKTTKSVWMFRGEGAGNNSGQTCEDRDYLEWILRLRQRGFEVALHNVAPGTSARAVTINGLDRFRQLFGPGMAIHCNHTGCRQNIYWDDARLSGWRRGLFNLATKGKRRGTSRGHIEGDPLFWGDLCQNSISYVRSFVVNELDTLAVCPEMPYHDARKPYVNYWFASANGSSLRRFLANFTADKLKALADAGGLCVAYVHFAAGFAENGVLNPEFQKRMEYLANLGGWFAPVSEVLDHLRAGQSKLERTISPKRLRQLETRWLLEKLKTGTS